MALALVLVAARGLLVSFLPRREVWFCGDFEPGGLHGWTWDRARPESIEVVTEPVRKGRYAVRLTVSPGDRAASKERAELKFGDKELERVRGRHGGEIWYGWSLFVPADFADPPDGRFHILGQWHHRPTHPTQRPRVAGPPPLVVQMARRSGRQVLSLLGRASPEAAARTLGSRPIGQGRWTDVVLHVKWSTGDDGFVEAWLDGKPWTEGKQYGPTLYSPTSNYLRLGLYRGKGVLTTNRVYYDEVRLGGSYRAVAP